ncbi:MAG: 2-dehydropantoate 2-reductase N-terminal domain-containing protein [Aestuariivirga sp.]
MKILVYGAGVIGSVYAARLLEAGHQVTVLARGKRLDDIRRYGLVLKDVISGIQSTTQVTAINQLTTSDQYDVILISVRRDQLASVIPALKANQGAADLVFMLNNPLGSGDLVQEFGQNRVILGFPGLGGAEERGGVQYAMIAQQPTTLGEMNGRQSSRVIDLAKTFRAAGFATRIEPHMDAWLKTHAFFVTAISGAIYLAGGNCHQLSLDKAKLSLMTKGVREGFNVVNQLGMTVTPLSLRILFTWMPQLFAVYYWHRYLSSEMADYVFGRHARRASLEMQMLANDCRTLMMQSQVETPALLKLYTAVDAFANQNHGVNAINFVAPL